MKGQVMELTAVDRLGNWTTFLHEPVEEVVRVGCAIVPKMDEKVHDHRIRVEELDEDVHRVSWCQAQGNQHHHSEPAAGQSWSHLCPVLFQVQNWRLCRHPILHCGS